MKTIYLDCGNTQLKWRLDSDNGVVAYGDLKRWAASSLFRPAPGSRGVGEQAIARIVYAAVRFDDALKRAIDLWSSGGIEVVRMETSERAAGVTCAYPDPSRLGVDRWLAVIGAWRQYGGDLMVVDAGTAITVDSVSASGEHHGGYIVPGLALMLRSLAAETERVKVVLSDREQDLSPAIETDGAVNRGATLMVLGLVTQALVRMPVVKGADDVVANAPAGPIRVFVCGGDAKRLTPHLEQAVQAMNAERQVSVIYAPDLVLDGLQILAEGD